MYLFYLLIRIYRINHNYFELRNTQLILILRSDKSCFLKILSNSSTIPLDIRKSDDSWTIKVAISVLFETQIPGC